jgi:hypothetical protein
MHLMTDPNVYVNCSRFAMRVEFGSKRKREGQQPQAQTMQVPQVQWSSTMVIIKTIHGFRPKKCHVSLRQMNSGS